jgi:hypothetical protein
MKVGVQPQTARKAAGANPWTLRDSCYGYYEEKLSENCESLPIVIDVSIFFKSV